ncbi:tail protein X [Sporomusa acidovorans]|uniref:Phage tail protein X n=1 Tax=Sporomusa acidovorans (strain ATCC 49682 / DSM 3132 / Mol) TaxID=1123286 RepID=A0ABZ3J8E8_SPOA4|nr:tail protein X [Sporomusa acidovorans]OZC16008.1 phage tail protein X [Sporomusa acidovorans DSM 3132]SDD89882.1 P2-like prophage tail protein X [Sporomusa acidovorans]
MTKYTTALGDTWDIIAYKMYGDERQISVLIEANPEYRETVIFSADVIIQVPDVAAVTSTVLPPWKR